MRRFPTRNRLLRHVQRHAQTTVLFAEAPSIQRAPAVAANAVIQPVAPAADSFTPEQPAATPATTPPELASATEPITLRPQASASSMPRGDQPPMLTRSPSRTGETLSSPLASRLSEAIAAPEPSAVVQQSREPLQPASQESETSTPLAAKEAVEESDDKTWQLLQTIYQRHEGRQEEETLVAEEALAADEGNASRSEERGPVKEEPIPPSPEQPVQAVPLESVWPVQRKPVQPPPSAPVGAPAADEQRDTPDTPDTKTVSDALRHVASGRPTESSVELVPPRRPRPGQPLKTPVTTAAQADVPLSVQHADEPGSNLQDSPAAPDMIETEIGALPADLWELLGESPPAPPDTLPPTEAKIPSASAEAEIPVDIPTLDESTELQPALEIAPKSRPGHSSSATSAQRATFSSTVRRKDVSNPTGDDLDTEDERRDEATPTASSSTPVTSETKADVQREVVPSQTKTELPRADHRTDTPEVRQGVAPSAALPQARAQIEREILPSPIPKADSPESKPSAAEITAAQADAISPSLESSPAMAPSSPARVQRQTIVDEDSRGAPLEPHQQSERHHPATEGLRTSTTASVPVPEATVVQREVAESPVEKAPPSRRPEMRDETTAVRQEQEPPIATNVREELLPPPVQRQSIETTSPTVEAISPAVDALAEEAQQTDTEAVGPDLDALAHRVYSELKRRLDVEWERVRGRF